MESRLKVAREAARLLYTGLVEEYQHAKKQAARNLGIQVMPSNYEVAVELDLFAEQMEGEKRKQRVLKMREIALEIMGALSKFDPILRGSVWRGTARKGSDIDIDVYSDIPGKIESKLRQEGYEVVSSKERVAINKTRARRSTHIFIRFEGFQVEIIVRPQEEMGELDHCEIYGDLKRGLDLSELEKLMSVAPLRKFIPERRK